MDKLINGLIEIIDLYTNKDFYIGQTNNPKLRIRQQCSLLLHLFNIVLEVWPGQLGKEMRSVVLA